MRSKPVVKRIEDWREKRVLANSRANQMKSERAEAPERSSWVELSFLHSIITYHIKDYEKYIQDF